MVEGGEQSTMHGVRCWKVWAQGFGSGWAGIMRYGAAASQLSLKSDAGIDDVRALPPGCCLWIDHLVLILSTVECAARLSTSNKTDAVSEVAVLRGGCRRHVLDASHHQLLGTGGPNQR